VLTGTDRFHQVADAIVQKALLRPTDVVLEIGPGTGNITVRLLEQARKVVAVELDPRMAAEVTKRVMGQPAQKKLEVLLGDAIKTDLPPFDVCVSNTPYQISSPLVFKLLGMAGWRTAVLMFQREFALRLTARPGDALYCRLSVNAQFFARVTHVLKVGRANFKPMPQVESAVVRLEPKTGRDRPTVDFREWDSVLRVCFNRKNKTLRASWLQKEVVGVVTRNYTTWASMNNVTLEEGLAEAEEEEPQQDEDGDGDMDMEVDEPAAEEGWEEDDAMPDFFKEKSKPETVPKTPSKRPKTKVEALVRKKILKVLEKTALSDKRARQCDENDFLRLLHAVCPFILDWQESEYPKTH
jgi:18S rRNA (adenine1779-N6/adenine1780-N6)-dimethyltransferase